MYKAALIGLGNIAWKLGQDQITGSSLCHKDAIDQHSKTRVVCAYSPDQSETDAFTRATGIDSASDLPAMLQKHRPDLVSICSPTPFHAEHLQICFDHVVPMIWLEKPATCNKQQLLSLLPPPAACKTLVNFQRRYTSSYQNLRTLVQQQHYGLALGIDIHYSRGLETNGSHMLDILFFVTGVREYEILWTETGDALQNPDCVLRLDNGILVHIHGFDLDYHNIDFSVTCTAGRLSILHGGMTLKIETCVEHELFPGFYRLRDADANTLGEAGFDHAFDRALDDLLMAHEERRAPLSNLDTALQTQTLLEDILQRSQP